MKIDVDSIILIVYNLCIDGGNGPPEKEKGLRKMTLTEMTAAINELHIAEAMEETENGIHGDVPAVAFIGDYAGVYNLDDEQAERIAERAETAEQFEDIWENEDWWV